MIAEIRYSGLPEVVKVQSPDHGSPQVVMKNVLGLVPDHGLVVEGDPLVTFTSVRANVSVLVLHYFPASLQDTLTYLRVTEAEIVRRFN